MVLLASGPVTEKKASELAYELRSEGFSVFYRFSGNFSKQMKRISQRCLFALICGEQELAKGEIALKDLSAREQCRFPLSHLREELGKKIQRKC